jgi:hypothetical protein
VTVATVVTVFAFAVSMVLGIVLLRTDLRARRNLFFAVYVLSIAVEALVQLRLSSASGAGDFLRYKHADVFTYAGVAALFQFVLLYVRSPLSRSWSFLSLAYGPFLAVIANVLLLGPDRVSIAEIGYLSSWSGWPDRKSVV